MSVATVISRTNLARNTRQVMDEARRGHTFIVESYGEEQVAILDILDYRLLRAAANYHARHNQPDNTISSIQNVLTPPMGLASTDVETEETTTPREIQSIWDRVIASYFKENISLGRAAQLLEMSRFDLMDRLNRLGLPLLMGPKNIEEAKAEYEVFQD